MSLHLLSPRHVFGITCEIPDNLHFIDEERILYTVGNDLVTYHLDSRTQEFLQLADNSSKIIACAFNKEKSQFACIISREDGMNVQLVDILTMKKRKKFQVAENVGKKCTKLKFTKDGNHLVALFDEPDWNLLVWLPTKGKQLHKSKLALPNSKEITDLAINEFEESQGNITFVLSIVGPRMLKVFNYFDGQLRPSLYLRPDRNMVCHAWINRITVAAGTEEGSVMIFVNGVPHSEITYNLMETSQIAAEELIETPPKITHVLGTANGFMSATETGMFYLFELAQESEIYRKTRENMPLDPVSISAAAIDPNEDKLVFINKNKQLHYFSLETDVSGAATKAQTFTLMDPFHSNQIDHISAAPRRTIVATSSKDKTLRVWNISDNQMDVKKTVDSDIYSMSIHPNGLYMLVGYSDSIHFCSILLDDIMTQWKEAIPGCKTCAFSTGGQYFAAAFETSLYVYTTWDTNVHHVFRGHDGRIKKAFWTQTDRKLITCGQGGKVIVWNNLKKSIDYTFFVEGESWEDMAVRDEKMLHLFTLSSTGQVWCFVYFKTHGKAAETKQKKLNFTKPVTKILYSNYYDILFCLTNDSCIQMYKFDSISFLQFLAEIPSHFSVYTGIAMSPDFKSLVATTKEGFVWTFSISDHLVPLSKRDHAHYYSDDFLTRKSDIEVYRKHIQDFQQKIESMKLEHDKMIKLKDERTEKTLNELSKTFALETKMLQESFDSIKNDMDIQIDKNKKELQQLVNLNKGEQNVLQKEYESRINQEDSKCQALSEQFTKQVQESDRQVEQLLTETRLKIEQVKTYYEAILSDKLKESQGLKKNLEEQLVISDQTVKDIEFDIEKERVKMSCRYEKMIQQEKISAENLVKDSKAAKSNLEELLKTLEEYKHQLSKHSLDEKRLDGQVKGYHKDIEAVKKELEEREESIRDKDRRIADLKKKNMELEKFKFVLDYKITELIKQVEPKEKDAKQLALYMTDIHKELVEQISIRSNLAGDIHELDNKMNAKTAELKAEKSRSAEMENSLKEIGQDLNELDLVMDNETKLKLHVIDFFHKYQNFSEEPKFAYTSRILNLEDIEAKSKPIMSKEYVNRNQMEYSLAAIEHKVSSLSSRREHYNFRSMKEKTVLNSDLNDIRFKINQIKKA